VTLSTLSALSVLFTHNLYSLLSTLSLSLSTLSTTISALGTQQINRPSNPQDGLVWTDEARWSYEQLGRSARAVGAEVGAGAGAEVGAGAGAETRADEAGSGTTDTTTDSEQVGVGYAIDASVMMDMFAPADERYKMVISSTKAREADKVSGRVNRV
jgi:hypothetical protein